MNTSHGVIIFPTKQTYPPFLVLYDLHNLNLGLDLVMDLVLDYPCPWKLHFHNLGLDVVALGLIYMQFGM